jgi:hypothetical protein
MYSEKNIRTQKNPQNQRHYTFQMHYYFLFDNLNMRNWFTCTEIGVLEDYFSHYYGVLTPLNQWWKNL